MKRPLVFTNGCFDILHAGHVRLLEFARSQGERLIVAINSDASVHRIKGHDRPIIAVEERAEILRSLRCVDDVKVFHEDNPEPLIRRLRPDVLVKGPACQRTTIPGAELVQSWGGRVIVHNWPIEHSTTAIVNRVRQCNP